MYQNQMACAIKVDGKVLRELDGKVFLPFGSEFSLVLKNLNTRRACVRITIDGQEAVHGGLIVNANSSVDLERFVKEGQMGQGNRFKFIERNEKVEETRGIKVDDGLIRFEVEYEREWPAYNAYTPGSILRRGLDRNPDDGVLYKSAGITGSMSNSSDSFINQAEWTSTNIAGITVPGSVSDQKFHTVSFTGDGVKTVMVLQLLGETEKAVVKKPITVKDKNVCSTCKHVNSATAKFCSECGTGLEIVGAISKIPARFAIGDMVVCKGHKHRVMSVRFTESKVYYGLAYFTNPNGDVIEYESEDVYPGNMLG